MQIPRFIPPWKTPEPPPKVEEAEIVPPVQEAVPEPVQAPVAAEPVKVEQVPVPPKVEHKYRAVRGSGDPIYILKDNQKHWVLNAETFKKLGFRFGEEEKIEQSELATYVPGKPITAENYGEFM